MSSFLGGFLRSQSVDSRTNKYRPTFDVLEDRSLMAGGVQAGTISQLAADDPNMIFRQQSFDRSPSGWSGSGNRQRSGNAPLVRQDFGYRTITDGEGYTNGAIGGTMTRSTTPAYFGDTTVSLNLNKAFRASGLIRLDGAENESGAMIGWFHTATQGSGWRPGNWLGFRLDSNGGYANIHVEYTTGTWRSVRLGTNFSVGASGGFDAWELQYDPKGGNGQGVIRFSLNGSPAVEQVLTQGHRQEGASFNRFGLFSPQVPGKTMTVYLDDISYNDGEPETFTTQPDHWRGAGNESTFRDADQNGANDFGYSLTNHAGQRFGELGGSIWRLDESLRGAYYGDRIGRLTLNDPLFASGTLAMTRASADSAVYIGWFNDRTISEPPKNFVGVVVEGPSRAGHYFRPRYGTAKAKSIDPKTGPLLMPDGQQHSWSMAYDPEGNNGKGTITVTLDERTSSFDIAKSHRLQGAVFNRFGLFTMRKGGHNLSIFLDDLAYTAGRK